MRGRVTLTALEGPLRGKQFVFDEHDTFLFGRAADCHARLDEADRSASRYQFVLEVNPPEACIRDLGSLNGTFVNDEQIGRRDRAESADAARQRSFPTRALQQGDRIRAGGWLLSVQAEVLLRCPACGASSGEFVAADDPRAVIRPLCQACQIKCRQVQATGETTIHRPAETVLLQPAETVLAATQVPGRAERPVAPAAAVESGTPPIPGYTLVKPLGSGGMGTVHLARRASDGKAVAVKVMLPRAAVDDLTRQMFLREIETTRSLAHPNIVEFIDSGAVGSSFFVALEYCSEGSLSDLQKRRGGRLPLGEAGPLMMDALAGLAHAHRNGFVHRDVKPPNILLAPGSRRTVAKVADMGLSKSYAKAGLSGMTQTGGYAGSYPFMPVEQMTNFKFAKPSGDVWSIGATFFHLLTGAFPREEKPGQDPVAAILKGEIAPIRKQVSDLPALVAEVIDRALRNQATERYADASEMWTALGQAL